MPNRVGGFSRGLALAGALLLHATLTADEMPGFPLVANYTEPKRFSINEPNSSAVQLRDGAIVVMAAQDLVAFDGRKWEDIKVDNFGTPISLGEDLDGTLLVGSYEEPGYLRPRQGGHLEFVGLGPLLPPDMAGTKVFSLPTGAEDGVYFVSFHRVFRWDRKARIDGWQTKDVFPSLLVANGELLMSEEGVGLSRVRGTTLEHIEGSASRKQGAELSHDKISGIVPFRSGWLMTTQKDGFRYFDGQRVSPIELPGTAALLNLPSRVIKFVRAADLGFIAADEGSNLLFFDTNMKPVGRWGPHDYPGLTTSGLLVDREGKAWTMTSSGPIRIDLNPGIRVLDVRAGWDTAPSAVHAIGNKRIFVTGARAYEWVSGDMPGTGRVVPRPDLGEVQGEADGDIFYAQVQGEELRCRYADGRTETLLPRGTWFVRPSAIEETVVYVEQVPDRLHVFRKRDGRWAAEGKPLALPFHIAEMSESGDFVWFTIGETRVARARRSPALSDLTIFDARHGLPDSWIRTIRCGADVLFATRSQIYVFNPAAGRFQPDPRLTRIPAEISHQFTAIATDGHDNIWVSSTAGSGIMRHQPDGSYEWDFATLSALAGRRIVNMTWDPAGWMWCFTHDQLFAVRPDSFLPTPARFGVKLEHVRDISADVPILGRWNQQRDVVLDYTQNALRFELSAPEFSAPRLVRFQANLQGKDSDWGPWTTASSFQYPSLREGAYTFRFRARNAFGTIVEGEPFAFSIKPPLYRTWLAYAAYVVALGGLFWLVAAGYSWRIRWQKSRLETLVQERTRALEGMQQKLVESSRHLGMAEIATGVLHNVGNALNSVNVSASLLAEQTERSTREPLVRLATLFHENRERLPELMMSDKGKLIPQYLESLVQRSAEQRAVALAEIRQLKAGIERINEIVAMHQVYATTSTHCEPLDPRALLEDALRLAQAAAGAEHMEVRRVFDPVPAVLVQRGNMLQIFVTLVEQSIRAARTREHGACITLSLQKSDATSVDCTISHNGPGFRAEEASQAFAAEDDATDAARGFRLNMASNMATEMNVQLTAKSEGPDSGVTYHLRMPALAEATSSVHSGFDG